MIVLIYQILGLYLELIVFSMYLLSLELTELLYAVNFLMEDVVLRHSTFW